MDERITKARELRRQGLSLKDINKQVIASKSSISKWVRDIELTEEQRKNLLLRISDPMFRRDKEHSEKFRKKRQEYQTQGRERAQKEGNQLHLAGCMLHWAEGSKNRNTLKISNTDPNLMKFFIRFLRECYFISNDRIKIHINCYTDKGKEVSEIEDFWLNELNLPRTSLGKTISNYDSRGKNNNKRKKKIWGICEIAVNSTELVQQVFGAIQEYSGFNNDEWLDILPGTCAGMV